MDLKILLGFPQEEGEARFELRLQLLGALVGLARATDGAAQLYDSTWQTAIHGITALYEALPDAALQTWVETCRAEKFKIVPDCATCQSPCGRTWDYDAALLSQEEPAIGAAKCALLKTALPLAQGAFIAAGEGKRDEEAILLIYRSLFILGEYVDAADVQALMEEVKTYKPNFA